MKFGLCLFAAVFFSVQVSFNCYPVDDTLTQLLKKLEDKANEYAFKYLTESKKVKKVLDDTQTKMGLEKIDIQSCLKLAKDIADIKNEYDGMQRDSVDSVRNKNDLTQDVEECQQMKGEEQLKCIQECNRDVDKYLVEEGIKFGKHVYTNVKLIKSIPENLKNCKPPTPRQPAEETMDIHPHVPNFFGGLVNPDRPNLLEDLEKGLLGGGIVGAGAGLAGLEALAPLVLL